MDIHHIFLLGEEVEYLEFDTNVDIGLTPEQNPTCENKETIKVEHGVIVYKNIVTYYYL